ncbi:hypothetical protein GCM10027589_25280 [Actinocorallia lasiicapitis]
MATDFTKVDPEALTQAQQTFSRTLEAFDNRLNELERRLGANLAEWDGDARKAYLDAKARWDKACQNLGSDIAAIAVHIGGARTNYVETEEANRRVWG